MSIRTFVYFFMLPDRYVLSNLVPGDNCCINCSKPGCEFYPEYKENLIGLSAHKYVHLLAYYTYIKQRKN